MVLHPGKEQAGHGVVPLVLLGVNRASTLRQRLTTCVDQWQRRWFGSSVELDLTFAPADKGLSTTFLTGLSSTEHGPMLQIEATREFVPRMLGLPAMSTPASSASGSGLAETLHTEILEDLGVALLELAALTPLRAAAADEVDGRERGTPHRWFRAAFSQAHCLERLSMLLHPALIQHWVPAMRRTAMTALAPRRQAIAPQTVRVEAWLGEVQLALSELASLHVGDVLVLESGTSAFMTAHDAQRIATLQLGRSHLRRAVSIGNVLDPSNHQGR